MAVGEFISLGLRRTPPMKDLIIESKSYAAPRCAWSQFFPFLALLVLFALPSTAYGHAFTIAVKVIDVSMNKGEYILQLEPQDSRTLPKRITVHLQFNPKKAAFAASGSRKDFDAALQVLKSSATDKKTIEIGLMSDKGFNPIKGRPGHFRSEMIQLVNWFKEPEVVCFFHSDHYEVAPK